MSGFWDKKKNNKPQFPSPSDLMDAANYSQAGVVLDEQAMAEIEEDPQFDVFEDEEEDTASIMSDANLRLEQGRLYQMILANDIFGNTDADPKAIRNVQREIRKFVRERMETMLGIRQEQAAQAPVISSPFNDTEVVVLKMLASKMSKGATEQNQAPSVPAQPKKDGITAINGNMREGRTTPLSNTPKTAPKPAPKAPKPAPALKSAIKEDESVLQKPIEDMTPEELLAHDAAALERRSKNYAQVPANLVPHPSPAQLEALYTVQANQLSAPGSAVATTMALMNRKN